MAERHQWSQSPAAHLHDIAVARAAQHLLDHSPPPGHLVVLPTWAWRLPQIDVGRKVRTHGGTRQTLPIPITWSGGPVQILPRPTSLDWSINGLGVHEAGTTAMTQGECDTTPVPTLVTATLTPTQIRAHLTQLSETGHQALWDLRQLVSPIVRFHLTQASHRIAAEIGATSTTPPDAGSTCTALLDDEAIEALVTDMVLGAPHDQGTTPTGLPRNLPPLSPVDRIINRLLTPSSLIAVDLNHYLNVAVRVESETAVRKKIGDPHIGRKVRALAAETSPQTLAELVTTYRDRFPNDKLSTARAVAALLVPLTAETIGTVHRCKALDDVIDAHTLAPVLGVMVDEAARRTPHAAAA